MFVLATKKKETPKKRTKNNQLLKTKRKLNIQMSAEGAAVFTFSLPGGAAQLFSLRNL